MAKTRATLTTCDFGECEDHFVGEETPETWIKVAVKRVSDDKPERLTFCSFVDLSNWAGAVSDSLVEAEAENDG